MLHLALVLAASAATATPVAVPADLSEPDPKSMSQKEIRAFNASLDKKHPFYIRCKRSAATGSFIERQYSCRTNNQWARADDHGNQVARDLMDDMKTRSSTNNQ